LLDFVEFAGGEFFPARADGGVVAEAAEEELDFGEGEAHVGGEADEEDAMEASLEKRRWPPIRWGARGGPFFS